MEQSVCELHFLGLKYFCINGECKQTVRFGCALCFSEGNHQGHAATKDGKIMQSQRFLQQSIIRDLSLDAQYELIFKVDQRLEKMQSQCLKFSDLKADTLQEIENRQNTLLQAVESSDYQILGDSLINPTDQTTQALYADQMQQKKQLNETSQILVYSIEMYTQIREHEMSKKLIEKEKDGVQGAINNAQSKVVNSKGYAVLTQIQNFINSYNAFRDRSQNEQKEKLIMLQQNIQDEANRLQQLRRISDFLSPFQLTDLQYSSILYQGKNSNKSFLYIFELSVELIFVSKEIKDDIYNLGNIFKKCSKELQKIIGPSKIQCLLNHSYDNFPRIAILEITAFKNIQENIKLNLLENGNQFLFQLQLLNQWKDPSSLIEFIDNPQFLRFVSTNIVEQYNPNCQEWIQLLQGRQQYSGKLMFIMILDATENKEVDQSSVNLVQEKQQDLNKLMRLYEIYKYFHAVIDESLISFLPKLQTFFLENERRLVIINSFFGGIDSSFQNNLLYVLQEQREKVEKIIDESKRVAYIQETCQFIFLQIFKFLGNFEKLRFVHGNLSLENILCRIKCQMGNSVRYLELKLCGFSKSKIIKQEKQFLTDPLNAFLDLKDAVNLMQKILQLMYSEKQKEELSKFMEQHMSIEHDLLRYLIKEVESQKLTLKKIVQESVEFQIWFKSINKQIKANIEFFEI